MFRAFLLVVILLVAAPLPGLASGATQATDDMSPVTIDGVVAIMEIQGSEGLQTRVILLSDLVALARLSRARAGDANALTEPVDRATLAETLDNLLNDLVVVDEATKLQLFQPTDDEIDQKVASIRASVGPAAYDSFVSQYDLDDLVHDWARREIRVSRYLESRFRFAARPPPSEVEAYRAKHAALLPSDPAAAAEVARKRVAHRRFQRLSEAFIADARHRARIRILQDPAHSPQPMPLSGSAAMADEPISSFGN